MGNRRLLQLLAEGAGRAVRAWRRCRSRRAACRKKVPSRSFYLDLGLLEDYWVRRKYHHTISAPLVYAVREALAVVEEEGLEQRWARHERNHRALAAGLEALGLSLLPPVGERLWTLNAVRVPEGDRRGRGSAAARSTSSASRSAPASVRSPDASGESV